MNTKNTKRETRHEICDNVPRSSNELFIAPIKSRIDRPSKKSLAICQWLQTSGDGEQMLSTVAKELASFHKDATVLLRCGFWGDLGERLVQRLGGSLTYVVKELWFSLQMQYWAALNKKHPQGARTDSVQEIPNRIQESESGIAVVCEENEKW